METNVKNAFRNIRKAFPTMRAGDVIRRCRETLAEGDTKSTFGSVAHFGQTMSERPFGDGDGFKIGGSTVYWCETPERLGMQDYGDAHELIQIDHTGWFVDASQSESATGAVYRWGRFYIPAIRDPYNDGPVMLAWSDRIACAEGAQDEGPDNDAIRDAARLADHVAEAYAENSREHDTAWQAGSHWADLHVENSAMRKKAMALIADIKKQAFSGPIREALREKLNDWLDIISENKNAMARLANGDSGDLIFWPSDKSLARAFNDGAGRPVIQEY